MRTPKKTIELAQKEFENDGYVITEVNKQAYLSSLAIASNIVLTCDSTSMISEAAISGKPIFIAHMKNKRNNFRFKKFFQLFKDMGITKNLGAKVEHWKYNNFNESERVAKIINDRLNK